MVKDDAQRITRIKAELLEAIGERKHQAWFGPRVQLRLPEETSLEVVVSTPFERDCIQRQFLGELQQACLNAGCGRRRVVLRVDQAQQPVLSQRTGEREQNARVQPEPAPLAAEPAQSGFSRYVVGPGVEAAARISARIAHGEQVASPLVLWGSSGVGKTHLLQAIRDEARRLRRRQRVIYLTAEQFTTGFVDSVHGRGRGLPRFRHKHRGVDLLLLDDVQFFVGKPRTLEEFQYTLDTLQSAGAQVVIGGDLAPSDWGELGPELASRFSAGLSVELQPPDFATRRRLLQSLAAEKGLSLNDQVTQTIAAGVIGGARELLGVVNRLQVANELLDSPIDEDAARSVVDETNCQAAPRVAMSDIQTAVCNVFGVDKRELCSGKRTRSATEPRMLAMWLSRKYTRAAWSEIGQFYGRRSHSTVISACRRVEQLMDRDALVRKQRGSHDLQDALRKIETHLRTA